MALTALLRKNLNFYFRIIKRSQFPTSRTTTPSDDLYRPFSSPSTATSWLPLYLKKYASLHLSSTAVVHSVANPSFDIYSSASTSDYDGDVEGEDGESTPDFSSIYASPRFFFSSPGRSNSILDSAATSLSAADEEDFHTAYSDGEVVEVQTESPDPYSDFRQSMEEMVEARELHDVLANWQSLQELLIRYLSLNPEPTHKFIAGAFADLLVSLMSPPSSSSDGNVGGGGAAIASCSYACH